jgi:hypothetical protein
VKLRDFRPVPTWIFLEQVRARRERGEPLNLMEAWCSLDYDFYRHGQLSSERAYAANWRRSREWVRGLMRHFREERGLAAPPAGRRPRPKPKPRPNGGLPTAPDYQRAIPETEF